jgi:hypothetical protein
LPDLLGCEERFLAWVQGTVVGGAGGGDGELHDVEAVAFEDDVFACALAEVEDDVGARSAGASRMRFIFMGDERRP